MLSVLALYIPLLAVAIGGVWAIFHLPDPDAPVAVVPPVVPMLGSGRITVDSDHRGMIL